MKKIGFNFQKWSIRAIVALGALLGISACYHTKKVVEDDNYNNNNMPPIHNLKYGPLVDINKSPAKLVKERIDENGNVVYDTIEGGERLYLPVLNPKNEDE